MGLVFARERLRDLWPEASSLMVANHEETGRLPKEDLAPDQAGYFRAEDAGLLQTFTARDAGRLVGYAVFVISCHLHYTRLRYAMQDVLYVDREHRGHGAIKFMLWTDQELEADGVRMIYRHVHPNNDYSRTLKRMGYELAETGYRKMSAAEVARQAIPAFPNSASGRLC